MCEIGLSPFLGWLALWYDWPSSLEVVVPLHQWNRKLGKQGRCNQPAPPTRGGVCEHRSRRRGLFQSQGKDPAERVGAGLSCWGCLSRRCRPGAGRACPFLLWGSRRGAGHLDCPQLHCHGHCLDHSWLEGDDAKKVKSYTVLSGCITVTQPVWVWHSDTAYLTVIQWRCLC